MISRLRAIQEIRCGRRIQLQFEGLEVNSRGEPHIFDVIIKRDLFIGGMEAIIKTSMMRRNYYIKLTPRQVLAYIRRHYPRHLPQELKEVA